MGIKVSNNAYGTLAASLSDVATTLNLNSGEGARFPTLGGSDYFYLTLIDTSNNVEIVKVTARSSDTMTIVRGQDGTTARSYAVNSRAELRPCAAMFAAIISEAIAGAAVSDGDKGDITVSGSGTSWLLEATGVSAGSYTNVNVTVDSKGRITAISNGSSGAPTTEQVLTALTGMTNGAIGAITSARFLNTSTVTSPGGTVAGSLIWGATTTGAGYNPSYTGTWRSLGASQINNASNMYVPFIRIA